MGSPTQEKFLDNTFSDISQNVSRTPWFLYFAAITADLLLVSFGSGLAWSSPVLAKLRSNDSTINPLREPITTLQTALIASIPLTAATATYLVWAKLADKMGRKLIIQIIATISVCCSLGLAFGTNMAFGRNIYVYYIFLFIFGCSLSGALIAVVYTNEIADDSNRGRLCCLTALAVPSGMLFSYIFGAVTSVKTFTLICSLPSFLCLVLSVFLTDTPTYLISKKKRSQAYKALEKLRQTKCLRTLELEYAKIESTLNTQEKRSAKKFWTRSTLRSFLQGLLGVVVQQISGILVINYYVAIIFSDAGFGLSGDTVGILVGLVQILTYLIIAVLIKRIGKRRLILFSSFSCSITMFLLGLYFYLRHIESSIIDKYRWIAIVFVILFIITYGLGLGPIPTGIVGEYFTENTRALGSAAVFTVHDFFMAVIVFTFPLISESFGLYTGFWIHSFGCLAGFVCLYYFFFETEGKTFAEIQNIINK